MDLLIRSEGTGDDSEAQIVASSLDRPEDSYYDLICFSHLRWNFVFQRPQHLLTRAAKERRVFYVEEPLFEATGFSPTLRTKFCDGVCVVTPVFPESFPRSEIDESLSRLLRAFLPRKRVQRYVLWYYTPMALSYTRELTPLARVYDCMDELTAFRGAPSNLKLEERKLLSLCQLVFTGGYSLYEAKCSLHSNVYPVPSSVDTDHFARARTLEAEPRDQRAIPRARLGFFGVIDERLDRELVDKLAVARPSWNFVFVGPVCKISPADLPRHANVHYLGAKTYDELPLYIAGWDVALLPFALNESTRYISPTKTPEYLSAGKHVVSTPIRDVVRPYAEWGIVRIAQGAEAFERACASALAKPPTAEQLTRVDRLLARNSWDKTWARMNELLQDILPVKHHGKWKTYALS